MSHCRLVVMRAARHLRLFSRQTKVQHPLCRGAQGNYAAFTKNYHKFISVTLSADSPSESPGRTSDEEDEEQEEEEVVASCRRGEIKDWAILLHLLPCLANHVRLFANELHRRRSYIAEIDEDLIAAGGARGVSSFCLIVFSTFQSYIL